MVKAGLSLFIFLAFFQEGKAQTAEVGEQIEKEARSSDKIRRNKDEPRISNKYYLGEYLIFDCEDRHFACVNALSFDLCKDWRKEDLKKYRSKLRCAHLKKFFSQEACFQEQMKQIHESKFKLFCLNPKAI